MCGIVGIAGPDPLDLIDIEGVRTALERMRQRGPDGDGIWRNENVVFGHRRLAVIDPREGAQPWIDAEACLVLVYNGEVYNFKSLRDRLRDRGHVFKSECDTEVVMRAYQEWGPGCVERFEGMFAFAVHDTKRNRILLARDRLGVKPLFYTWRSGRLTFGSTVAALLALPGVGRSLDLAAFSHYLQTIRITLGDRTLIDGVLTLEPGEWIEFDIAEGLCERRIYWQTPVMAEEEKVPVDFPEACAEARRLVESAVVSQLVSDVPLGGFLSGGIDSCVLAASAIPALDGRFAAYGVGYDRDGYQEWEYMRKIASHYGIDAEEVSLTEETYAHDWRTLIREKGLPLSTPNEVPIFCLARAFRERMTVALTGEGADELFGGYIGPHFSGFDFDRAAAGAMDASAVRRFYGVTSFDGRKDHFFRVNSWIGAERKRRLLAPEVLNALNHDFAINLYYDQLFDRVARCGTIEAHLHVHARVNMEGLLARLDNSTMAASVEGRVPFTDHRLAEWLFSLPESFKLGLRPESNGVRLRDHNSFEIGELGLVETKRLLRGGFAGLVPAEILARPKMSFPVPFNHWFSGSMKEECRERISGSRLLAGLTDGLAEEHCFPQNGADPMLIWPLMNLCLWEEMWNVSLES